MIKDTIIAKQYQIKGKIGKGGFGNIWKAINLVTKTEVAIKSEDITEKYRQLHTECKIYLWLHKSPKVALQKIPKVYYYGIENDKNIMVMDMLGDSLLKKFKICGLKFSLKTVLMVADQMINRLSFVHSRFIIHRDIKPGNFTMGYGKNAKSVYIIDFGMAKKFMSCSTKEHIKFKVNKVFNGTEPYASCNAHLGYEQSRRDDLESLGYVFVYLLKGVLPWPISRPKKDMTPDEYREFRETIQKKKLETPVEEICEGCPDQFAEYLTYVKKLEFDDEPDYVHLRMLFRNLFEELKYVYDYKYDWCYRSGGDVTTRV